MANSDRPAGSFVFYMFICFDKKRRYFDSIIIFSMETVEPLLVIIVLIESYVGDRSPWLSGKVLSVEHGRSFS